MVPITRKAQRGKLRILLLAFVSSAAFFMNHSYTGPSEKLGLFSNILYQTMLSLKDSGYLISLGFVGFLLFYQWAFRYIGNSEKVRFHTILSLFFAGCHVAGITYVDGTGLIGRRQQILNLFICLAGFYEFYDMLIRCFWCAARKDISTIPFVPAKWKRFFHVHPWLCSFLCLIIAWLPHLLIRYPVVVTWDSRWQIYQAIGDNALNNHHPISHTLMIAFFVKFGKMLGSSSLGFFLYSITQAVVTAWVYSYCISVLVRIKAHRWTIAGALLFFMFCPHVFGYVGVLVKDAYFVAFSILFTVLLAEYALDRSTFWATWKRPVSLVLTAIFMTLMRNNGIYVILPTALILLLVEIIQRKEKWKNMVAVLLLLCVLPAGTNTLVKNYFKPTEGSIAEALSFPFQQTARFVRDHEDLVTEEEQTIIAKILPYDELADLYNPIVSDPVKARYNSSATTEDLINYFGVWVKQFFKAPGCYLMAVLEQNLYLAYPGYNNYSVYVASGTYSASEVASSSGEVVLKTPAWLLSIQKMYDKVMCFIQEAPVICIVCNMATYTMLALVIVLFIFTIKDYKHLIYIIPVLLAYVIVVLAPCIRWQVRYSFPIVYAVPLMLGFFTSQLRGKKNG